MRQNVAHSESGGSTDAVALESPVMVSTAPALNLVDHGPMAWLSAVLRFGIIVLAHALLLGYIAHRMSDTTLPEPPKTIEVALIAPPAPKPVAPPPVVTPPAPPKPVPPPPVPEVKKPEPPKPVVKPKPRPRPTPKKAISEPKPEPAPEPTPPPVAEVPAEPTPAPPAPPAPSAPVQAPVASQAAAPVTQASFDAAYLNNPRPAYPRLSRRLNETGKVLLRVRVSPEGAPEQVNLHQSSGHNRLDDAARRAVAQWRFVPAKQGGTPIASWVIVPIEFKLEDR